MFQSLGPQAGLVHLCVGPEDDHLVAASAERSRSAENPQPETL